MTITAGDQLPNATLRFMGPDGPEATTVSALTKGKSVVLFGLPGPFTGTCSTAHIPSFIRTRQAFADKGIDDVICFAVCDVFVMKEWAQQTGAEAAGITMLVDPDSSFTKSLGLEFSVPPLGFIDRTTRFAAVVRDGTVDVINFEEARGVCELTAGETLLEAV